MKNVSVEIAAGLLGSGKTAFINEYIESSEKMNSENTVLIQFERGKTEPDSSIRKLNINIGEIEDEEEISLQMEKFIKETSPENLIIEWNGMRDIGELFKILDRVEGIKVRGVRTIVDTGKFSLFYQNYRELIEGPVSQSDLVLINGEDGFVFKEIEKMNEKASIFTVEDFLHSEESIRNGVFRENPLKTGIKFAAVLIGLFFAYNIFILGGILNSEDIDMIKGVLTVSMGIVLEAVPFVLLGVLISALIQQLVTEEKIVKIIPKNRILGVFTALFMGFLFPVCDCASVPIAARLMKKKVPIYIALIFMLSSPVINPTVILATYYAFRDIFPDIIYIRLILGIITAVSAGLITSFVFRNREIFKDGKSETDLGTGCSCGYCIGYNPERGIGPFIRHVADEFISVGKYLIAGSIIAAVFQVALPIEIVYGFSDKTFAAVIVMVIFSYLISLCSTSDAFVAKSFFLRMPAVSVIGFLISGAMIDVKNTLVLSGIFRKRFTAVLVISVIAVSVTAVMIFSRLFAIY